MGRTNGRNALRYSATCRWCGMSFMASRTDAKTCSTQHRQALGRWVKKHGKQPTRPPAAKTVAESAAPAPTRKAVLARQAEVIAYLSKKRN